MLDYKLVLILVLSIVLLFIYNKVEELREDINKIKKKEIYISTSNNEKRNVKSSNDLLELFKTSSIKKDTKKTSDELLKLLKTQKIIKKKSELPESLQNPICESNKCILQVQNNNHINILENDDNTNSYNATEISDSLSINYENSTSATDNNFIIYSNEKENKETINIQNILNNIQQNNEVRIDSKPSFSIKSDMISGKLIDTFDIIQDSSNSDKNNINLCKIEELNKSSSNNSDDEIMNEFNNIQILEQVNGNILLVKENDNEKNSDHYVNDLLHSEENIQIENKLIISNSENKFNLENELVNTPQFEKIYLNSITKYKLHDLQKLSKKYNIITTKERNGKSMNKTKKELYNELIIYKEN